MTTEIRVYNWTGLLMWLPLAKAVELFGEQPAPADGKPFDAVHTGRCCGCGAEATVWSRGPQHPQVQLFCGSSVCPLLGVDEGLE